MNKFFAFAADLSRLLRSEVFMVGLSYLEMLDLFIEVTFAVGIWVSHLLHLNYLTLFKLLSVTRRRDKRGGVYLVAMG